MPSSWNPFGKNTGGGKPGEGGKPAEQAPDTAGRPELQGEGTPGGKTTGNKLAGAAKPLAITGVIGAIIALVVTLVNKVKDLLTMPCKAFPENMQDMCEAISSFSCCCLCFVIIVGGGFMFMTSSQK